MATVTVVTTVDRTEISLADLVTALNTIVGLTVTPATTASPLVIEFLGQPLTLSGTDPATTMVTIQDTVVT